MAGRDIAYAEAQLAAANERIAEAERLLRRWQDCYGFNGLNPALCEDTRKFLEAK